MTLAYVTERFTPEERAVLARHFTNLEGPVFALVDLPEAVKGAMFARYSRTTKSLRRLFLDEFAGDISEIDDRTRAATSTAGSERAARLYDSVFVEYGDDSVAQLGGVHLACEQSSQLLAKALEWGRLAAYLEQSTRYMRYDDRAGRRLAGDPATRARRHAGGRAIRGVPRRGVHDLRPHVRADGSVVQAASSRSRTATATSSTARRSWPRPATPSGCSCRRGRGRTWASTRPASPTSSC